MNGIEFYEYLRRHYNHEEQHLYGNFTFHTWLFKPVENTYSFQFNININNRKSISKQIIIDAWDANQNIEDDWLQENFGLIYNDCRRYVLNFLINDNANLR